MISAIKTPVNKVSANILCEAFSLYSAHYKLTPAEDKKAWEAFQQLKSMDITLGLALDTAVAVSRF